MTLFLLTAICLADIVPPEQPQLDERTTIQVIDTTGNPVPGASVRVTYRPNTHSTHEVNVGLTDGRGTISWTPVRTGPVIIRALNQEARITVPSAGLSAEACLLLLFSMLAASGAALYALSPFSRAS